MVLVRITTGQVETYDGTGFSVDGDGRLLIHGEAGDEAQGLGYKLGRRKSVVAIVEAGMWVSVRIDASR